MIDWPASVNQYLPQEKNSFTSLKLGENFGNLGKTNSGNILVGTHAVVFAENDVPLIFSVGYVCVDNGKSCNCNCRKLLRIPEGIISCNCILLEKTRKLLL